MPIPDDVANKLAEEALEKSGGNRQQPRTLNDADDRADRLRMAASLLGSALDAHDKAAIALRQATNFFISEFTAAVGANVDPSTLLTNRSAVERMAEKARPKTFNSPTGAGNGNDSG